MINFNSNKLVIVCYPAGGGGKFLINSLGLSNGAVLQDQHLAEKQLAGQLYQIDKLNILEQRLAQITNCWNDLNLGCFQLFGINSDAYLTDYKELIQPVMFNNIIRRLTSTDSHYFFLVAHNFYYLRAYLNYWPNAQIILVKNHRQFADLRSLELDQAEWQKYRGSSWPEKPPATLEEFNNYPTIVKDEMINQASWLVKPYLYKFVFDIAHQQEYSIALKELNVIEWDANCYMSREHTLNCLSVLYNKLNLLDFNRTYIGIYYDQWMQKLKELSNIKEINN